MFEKNKLVNVNRKKTKILHGNYAQVDPNAEITSAFINQAISQVDGVVGETPVVDRTNVIRARNWVDENKK